MAGERRHACRRERRCIERANAAVEDQACVSGRRADRAREPPARRPSVVEREERCVTSARESSVPPYGPAGPGMRSRSGQLAGAASRAVPAVGLVGGAVFVASQLNHGWVPWDDGTLAQSAQRVLLGELPHRDFAELYTGGLSFLNAGVLWLTGGNLFWLRAPMLLLFLAYLSCVYLDRTAIRIAHGRDPRRAVRRRVGASGLPGRHAVVVRALPRGDRRLLPRTASRDRPPGLAVRGGCRRRPLDLLQDHRCLVRAGGRRCTSCTGRRNGQPSHGLDTRARWHAPRGGSSSPRYPSAPPCSSAPCSRRSSARRRPSTCCCRSWPSAP